MKLKNSCNYWCIIYERGPLKFSTIFNSGFIDDIDMVRIYFGRNNHDITLISIEKHSIDI